jgi:Na+-translocating ferredoxin:NAD+ oxidoreductase subunit D
MILARSSSPYQHNPLNTSRVMQLVLLATLPGLVALTWNFGWGTLINIVIATTVAVACEAGIIRLRQRPVLYYLKDYSAVVTAVLLGLALPPLAPWWLVTIGTFFAIAIAKHLYGGLGYNPFNPAMIGYVVLLISFPREMTIWITPRDLLPEGAALPGIVESLQRVFGFSVSGGADGFTGATPLDTFKHNAGMLVEQLYAQQPLFREAEFAAYGWEWVTWVSCWGEFFCSPNGCLPGTPRWACWRH